MLKVGMKESLEKVLEDFGEILTLANAPAKNELFDMDEKHPKVKEHNRKKFHRIVMALMHVALRGRKSTQLPIKHLSLRANTCAR